MYPMTFEVRFLQTLNVGLRGTGYVMGPQTTITLSLKPIHKFISLSDSCTC